VSSGIGPTCETRTRIVRSESDAGRLTRATAAVDPRLDGVVSREYVGVAQDAARPFRWLQPPIASLTLIVTLREPVQTAAGGLPEDWVGGMNDTPDVVELPPRHESLDFKLTPLGAYAVIGIPVCELTGAFRSLEDLFGPSGRRLGDQVRDTPDWPGRFALVEEFLLRRAATGPQPTPVVVHACSRLCQADGRLGIGELAATVGCSRRYLAAKFRDEVGLTPKTAARVLRFADVRRRLQADPARFADIAQACGYYDQAHLNRDFRELAGTTPTDFVARQSVAGRPGDGEVTFVQDRTSAGA
jgi:AraC-like DNA-binding protein